jgi:hypothetical protein
MSAADQEVKGALERIESKHHGVIAELRKAPGYAVFPSVGRAGAVLGATLSQVTLGVQVGGQTFSELVISKSQSVKVFDNEDALELFNLQRPARSASPPMRRPPW